MINPRAVDSCDEYLRRVLMEKRRREKRKTLILEWAAFLAALAVGLGIVLTAM